MSTTDKILKEMEQMSKGGEGSGVKGHKTESNQYLKDVATWEKNSREALKRNRER